MTHISNCTVWLIPIIWSVQYGKHPHIGLFVVFITKFLSGQYPDYAVWGLANNHFLVLSVCLITTFRSVFGLASTYILVCSILSKSTFRSVRHGQYPYLGLFGRANIHVLVRLKYIFFCLFSRGSAHISVFSECLIPLFRSLWSG